MPKTPQVPLNERMRRFVNEYLCDLNATQAAIRSGYSADTASEIASGLMRDERVRNLISFQQKRIEALSGIKVENVVRELAAIAFSDPLDCVNPETGALLPLADMPEQARRAVASIDVGAAGVLKLRLLDKVAALDKLMRHLGAYNDKLEVRTGVKLEDLIPRRPLPPAKGN